MALEMLHAAARLTHELAEAFLDEGMGSKMRIPVIFFFAVSVPCSSISCPSKKGTLVIRYGCHMPSLSVLFSCRCSSISSSVSP